MTQLMNHPLATKMYFELNQEIETLPPSEQQTKISTKASEILSQIAALEEQRLIENAIYAELYNHAMALHMQCVTVDVDRPYTPDHPIYQGMEEHKQKGEQVALMLRQLLEQERLALRPEVRAFALLMEERLKANDHKGGCKQDFPDQLFWRIEDELKELRAELHQKLFQSLDVGKECADIANFAMMVADVCGALAVDTP